MTRHSKSNNDGAIFTYYERQRMRHGSERMRLPGVSMKAWYECALSLKPPRDPVVTPAGVVYDREAILNHLLIQKERARLQREERERRDAAERDASRRLASEQRVEKERRAEQSRHFSGQSNISSGARNMDEKEVLKSTSTAPNFWLPGAKAVTKKRAPSSPPREENISGKRSKSEKRSAKTVCPVSGNPLRLRDLISIRPTAASAPIPLNSLSSGKRIRSNHRSDENKNDVGVTDDGENTANDSADHESNGGGQEEGNGSTSSRDDADADRADEDAETADREDLDVVSRFNGDDFRGAPFVCALCRAAMSNAAKPVALRTGTVLCAHCVDEFVRRDCCDPLTATPIDVSRDVIVIDNSGTAFAGSTPKNPESREARIYRPSAT